MDPEVARNTALKLCQDPDVFLDIILNRLFPLINPIGRWMHFGFLKIPFVLLNTFSSDLLLFIFF